MRVSSLDHIHLYSADADAAVDFYSQVFGAEPLGVIPGSQNQGVLLGGQLLVIGPFPQGIAPRVPPPHGDGALSAGFGVAHFGLQTHDLVSLVERAERAGAEIHSEPRKSSAVDFVYLTGPDGVVLEITQLRLSPALKALQPILEGYNRLLHLTRKAFVSQIFEARA